MNATDRKQTTARLYFWPGNATAPVLRVNCNGPAVAPFAADIYSTLGGNTTASAINTAAVTGPAPEAVYQRRTSDTTGFSYLITGLTDDVSYRVRLHFAEITGAAAGVNVFVVNGTGADGVAVLPGVDIRALAGAGHKAVILELGLRPVDGAVQLTFSPISGKAQISGIEFIPTSPSYIHLCDTAKHKFAPDIKRTSYSAAFKGRRLRAQEMPYECHWRWLFTLDEQVLQVDKWRYLARVEEGLDFGIGSTDGTVLAQKGASYALPGGYGDAQKFTSLELNGNPTPVYVEGVDYTVDLAAGIFTILATGGIANGSTVYFSVSDSDSDQRNLTHAVRRVLATGTWKILEFDQFSEVPREIADFPGQAILTGLGDDGDDKPTEFELEVTASGAVTIQKRKD